jgi:amino acid adenylation domain-containing protein
MTITNNVARTSNRQNIEAIYPLSPTQQGMLFHSLQSSELYFQQMTCRLQGDLRIPQWEEAWQRVVDQHPILRTAFVWDKGNQPLQIVCKKVQLPWQHYDWQDAALPTAKRFETFLQLDRLQGLPLNQAPLMRFTLIQTAPNSYYLVWSYHHILIDGWSLSTIIQQVLACYEALCSGQQPLLAVARPYQDYINWLQKQDAEKAQEFWRDRLRGFTEPTSLRIECSAIDLTQPAQYCEQHLSLTAALTSQLQHFAKEYQLTINTIIQGAWALLLAQYSGTNDILFGATVAGRPPTLAGVESMVGLFINTLPVRVQVPTTGLLLDWLRSLQAQQVAQDAYGHSPLVDIQAESEIANGLPLFTTIVVFENYPLHNSVTDQLQHLGITEIRSLEQTNYPLTLVVLPGAELELKISYDNRRYDADDLRRVLSHLQTLLRQIVEQAMATIDQISLATLPVSLDSIDSSQSTSACIHQLFEQQASQHPQAVALIYEEQQFTYQQLNQQANQLAHHLRDLGIGSDMLVGIGLARSPELIVAILAVLKAGGAYVPLDPQYPPERLAFILADAQVALLLTSSDLPWPSLEVPVVAIDTDWPTATPLHNLPLVNRPTDLAYVIYTSGSTGQPKGVLIPHANVCRLFSQTAHWFGFDHQDVWTMFHSCAFDFSVWEIWGALLHGGQLVVVPYWISRSPQDLYELLQRHRVTVLNQTPSAFQQLLAVEAHTPQTNNLALRWVIFGGEALDIASLRPWFERHGDRQPQLVNMYGITETTVHVTYRPLTIADLDRAQGSVVGEPIPDLQLYVLDPAQRLQPIGVVGEIYVGGAGLAQGYLHRPELTAARFLANPFSVEPTARLYRTGDLARRLPNGDLEYKGRIDQQVKVRGFRIELGEIEAAINTHPGIGHSVVILREDIPSHQQLVAYVVAEAENISADLRHYLTNKLPEFMVPAAIIQLTTLPLTSNGKLDRTALPAPQARANASKMVQPRTDQEETMAKIWQAVLGLEQVSIHDNFFEMGGDSILSLQIVARANQAGMLLTPQQLFEQPTIASLVTVANTGVAVRATQSPIIGPVPLTPIQHWFFGQELMAPEHFNQSVLLTIPADFRPELLEQVLQHLYLHHDALRLRLLRNETGWQQSNAPFTDRLHLQVVEVEDAALMPTAIAQVDRQLQGNFQLQSGCLLQAALFQLNHQPAQLLMVVHHLAIDGVSWRILLADLETAYQQQRQGQMIRLPAKSTDPSRFCFRP